jgi:hypothetical protein
MATFKTVSAGSLGNYELRAMSDGEIVKIQYKELGAARFATKKQISKAEWDAACNRRDDNTGALVDLI